MCRRTTTRVSFAEAARNFGGNRKGSAAVQFAMIGAPFLLMLFAIIEMTMMFFAQQVLENATQDAARLIMTGQAKAYTQAQFKAALCDKLSGTFFDCSGGIYINSQSSTSFSGIAPVNPIDSSGKFVNNFSFTPGSSGSIMLVQVFYRWPLFVTTLGYNAGNVDGSYRLLSGAAAFRNEPYPSS